MRKNIHYILISFTLFAFLGCSLNNVMQMPSFKKDTPDNTTLSEWSNYYYGVTPCASCPGIETWVFLKHTKKENKFSLVQNYLEESDGVFMNKGNFTLKDNILTLTSKNIKTNLRLNKDSVSFVKSSKDSVKPEYTLEKLESFKDKNKIVLVIPKSVKQNVADGEKSIEFNALSNFNLITSHANSSLKAHYIIKCASEKSYIISKGIYYQDFFATGESKPYTNKNMENFQNKDDAIRQVQKLYCNK